MPTTTTFSTLKTDMQRYLERGSSAITDPTVFDQLPRLINLAERRLARKLKVQLSLVPVTSTMVAGTSVYAKPDRWRDTTSIRIADAEFKYTTVSRSSAAGVRTLVLNEPHEFEVGGTINVNSVGSATYNGSFTVSAKTQLSVSYVTGSLTEASTADTGGKVASSYSKRREIFARAYEYCRKTWPDADQTSVPSFYADYDLQHWLFSPTPDRPYPYEVLQYQLPPLLDDSNQQNVWTEYAPEALLYGALLEATPFLKEDSRVPVWQSMYDSALNDIKGEEIQKILDRSAARTED
jgi:hypothetical protein